ncbi:MAG: hypothetical protein ABJM58_00735 [Alteripontixanthobacter sp.]
MITLKRLIAPALGAALAAGIAAPASANYYEDPRQIRHEIRNFERQIDRAANSGRVSDRNATWLSYRLQGVERQFRQFSYNGFNDWEISTLNDSLNIMEWELQRRSNGYRNRSGRGYRDSQRGYNRYENTRRQNSRYDNRRWRGERDDDDRYERDDD